MKRGGSQDLKTGLVEILPLYPGPGAQGQGGELGGLPVAWVRVILTRD